MYNWFFFSSRRRHTRCALVTGVQRVLFRSDRAPPLLAGVPGAVDDHHAARSWRIARRSRGEPSPDRVWWLGDHRGTARPRPRDAGLRFRATLWHDRNHGCGNRIVPGRTKSEERRVGEEWGSTCRTWW